MNMFSKSNTLKFRHSVIKVMIMMIAVTAIGTNCNTNDNLSNNNHKKIITVVTIIQ